MHEAICYNMHSMHRTILLTVTILLYYGLSTWALYLFNAGLLVTALVYYGLPALVLAQFTLAPTAVLLSVAFLGGGLSLLLQGVAHIYGLWYVPGVDTLRLFGLVPLEQVAATVLESIFLVLLYEVFFDDGQYTVRSAWHRMVFFVFFFVAVLVLLGLHQFILGGVFVNYSFVWVVGILVASVLGLLAMHRSLSIRFFDRITDFAVVAAIPLGLALFVGIHSVSIVFGQNPQYLATVWYFGETVPIEMLALLFVVPFFIGTVYEVYLDDDVAS